MDRKKTILIAILINAGLLVLLFVAAIHREEPTSKHVEFSQTMSLENKPLFNEPGERVQEPLALQQSVSQESFVGSAPSTLNSALQASSAEIVHQLPPIAAQDISIPVNPAPMVLAPPAPPSVSAPASLKEITVKKGDTLEKIAKAHRTTAEEIRRLNQLASSFLRIGQVLKLPAEKEGQQIAKAKASLSEKTSPARDLEYYTVKVGDNPWTIAMKHKMKVDELLKLNSLNEEKARRLKPGDRLRVR